jgi:hypothetical protein
MFPCVELQPNEIKLLQFIALVESVVSTFRIRIIEYDIKLQ